MNSSEWKKYSLGEICSLMGGTAFPRESQNSADGTIPFIKVSDLNTNGNERWIDYANNHISESEAKKLRAKIHPPLATTFAKIGIALTFNRRRLLRKRTIVDNNMASAVPNKSIIDPIFFYYLLLTVDFNKISSGTALPYLNFSDLEQIPVYVPTLTIQWCIAEILSSLDDKIELNQQTNATLEAIAQAIFKEWFVDFNYPGATGEMVESELGPIPKGWRVGILNEVLSSLESGSRPKGGVGNLSEGIPSIGAENINGLGFYDYSKEKYVSKEFFAKLKRGIVKSEDVLLYKDGASLGRKTLFMDNFPHQTCAINEHVFILRSNRLINQFFLYFWLDQSYMTEYIKNINSNSAQPGINQSGVKSLPILIPEKKISNKFEQTMKPLLSNLFSNCKESNSLARIRDELLPKLMNRDMNF